VLGPLYELVDCMDPNKWTAVEVTAGQRFLLVLLKKKENNKIYLILKYYISLFHVVVDTDDTATKVLEALNREQNGRVTFMPLNRLRTKTLEYPESNDKVIPMIEVLKFDNAYAKAVEQVSYIALI
jgi:structural maintenance of chromosome 3 (chondroitin sulfate proteoglycan 6)